MRTNGETHMTELVVAFEILRTRLKLETPPTPMKSSVHSQLMPRAHECSS